MFGHTIWLHAVLYVCLRTLDNMIYDCLRYVVFLFFFPFFLFCFCFCFVLFWCFFKFNLKKHQNKKVPHCWQVLASLKKKGESGFGNQKDHLLACDCNILGTL